MSQNPSSSTNYPDWMKEMDDDFWDETDDEMAHYLIEQISNPPRHTVPRDREAAAELLYNDYFSTNPIYPEHIFQRRFQMGRDLFVRIVNVVEAQSDYFKQQVDAAKRIGLCPYQKCTAIRILAYGSPADVVDEYIKIGKTTAIQCLHKFCHAIIDIFGGVYLRRPNVDDVQQLLQMHEECHRFPGMLGSLDCMHWAWKNCPVAWKGQYTRGDHGHPTIMLEAVASVDLWIWHAYFGVAGSNNDLNVLSRSNLFQEELQDGIYLEWARVVKSFSHPQDPKRLCFKQKHESARKDVERAFGVLQARFSIVRGPARPWHKSKLHDIVEACIILHNMIVEDERHKYTRTYADEVYSHPVGNDVQNGIVPDFEAYLAKDITILDRQKHHQGGSG